MPIFIIVALSRFGLEVLEISSIIEFIMDTNIEDRMKKGFFVVGVGE